MTSLEVSDLRFRAMGTDCHIRGVGHVDLEWGRREVDRLAQLWTRFAPSEVMELTAEPREVDPDTALLLRRAVEGFDLTDGLFNPFQVAQIEAAGYDRDFADMQHVRRRSAGPAERPEVSIDGNWVSSTLPLDSGGLGKGLAADLIAHRLLARGAEGVLVNLGGDVRCAGSGPGGVWKVGVELPVHTPEPLTVRLSEGAVCTSTPLLRRWTLVTGGQAHHLLDPRTGAPMRTDLAAVTVIAPQAWLGEVLTKAVFLMTTMDATALLRRADAAALLVSADGHIRQLP